MFMKMGLTYPKLKIFYYAAINKSLKQAALYLYVTEGAVSQQIKDLETRLGKRLFERSSRKINLTPDGLNLFNLIAPLIEKVENVVDEFEQISGKLRGKITVASFEAMLLHVLPDYLNRFRNKYPECEIFLINGTGREIESMVLSGRVDFGIGSTEELPEEIIGKELWRVKRYFIAPLGHPLSRKRRLTLQDMARVPFVMPDRASKTGHRVVKELERHNPNLKVTVEAGDWEVVMKYVEMGFGVSMLPGMVIQPKDKKRLYLRDLSEVDEKSGISKYGILLKRGKYISPAAKELIRFLSPEIDFNSWIYPKV
jgi:DNA-binding transcriptional LysR family regulator